MQRIGSERECPRVAELEVRHLQLHLSLTHSCPVFATNENNWLLIELAFGITRNYSAYRSSIGTLNGGQSSAYLTRSSNPPTPNPVLISYACYFKDKKFYRIGEAECVKNGP